MTLSVFWLVVVPVGLSLAILFARDTTTPNNKAINQSPPRKKRRPPNAADAPKGMMPNPNYGIENPFAYGNHNMWIRKPLTASQIQESRWWDEVERERCKELNVYRHKGLRVPKRLGSPAYHKEHGKLNVPKQTGEDNER